MQLTAEQFFEPYPKIFAASQLIARQFMDLELNIPDDPSQLTAQQFRDDDGNEVSMQFTAIQFIAVPI